jgi:putative transposase
MARPLRIQYPGAYYHVTCRGNERRVIFRDEQDRKNFLDKLALSLEIYQVSLLAYVCMTNHFHLLVTTPEGNLSEFMRHFNISYTSAFNRRHGRIGHLYQGRYKAFLIDADSYLLEVSRYIHVNPVRLRTFAERSAKEKWEALLGFRASSLPGYLFSRKREDFIDYEMILGQMGGDRRKGRQGYREFIQWGIEHEPESPLELGKGHGIVGESDFVEWIKERFVEKEVPRREQPALRELTREYEPEKLMDRFAELVDREKGDICRRGRHSLERSILMEYLYRFCRLDQAEIGKLMGGIDYSAVSQARKRLQLRLRQDPGLMKRFAELSERLLQLSKINGLLPKSLDLVGKLPSE